MKGLDNAMKGKEMEITKVKYKCGCGAVMEMSKEGLKLLNEGQAYLTLRCPWCGYAAKNYTTNPEENELIKRLEEHIKKHEWRYNGVLVIFTDALKHILEEAKERQ
jgi:DNA-directed RNA polymerase subunit RPC12/RpoP